METNHVGIVYHQNIALVARRGVLQHIPKFCIIELQSVKV